MLGATTAEMLWRIFQKGEIHSKVPTQEYKLWLKTWLNSEQDRIQAAYTRLKELTVFSCCPTWRGKVQSLSSVKRSAKTKINILEKNITVYSLCNVLFTMSWIQSKITTQKKKQENMTSAQRKRQSRDQSQDASHVVVS